MGFNSGFKGLISDRKISGLFKRAKIKFISENLVEINNVGEDL